MKITKLASLVVSVMALAACGGGGSGGGSSAPSVQPKPIAKENNSAVKLSENKKQVPAKNEVNKETDKKNPEQPKSPLKDAEKTKVEQPKQGMDQPKKDVVPPPKEPKPTVQSPKEQLRELPIGKVENEKLGFGIVTGYNNKYSFNGAWKEVKNKDELKELVVEETKIPLLNKLSAVGGLKGIALVNAFEAAWNVTIKDDGGKRDVFYFGDETPVSVVDKQKGKAVYKGNVTRYDNVKARLANVGKSTLNVDFDTKKVSGELAIDGLFRRNIVLEEAGIKGNGFEGVAIAGKNHVLRQVEGRYEGKFFGPNADEVAGLASFKEGKQKAIVGKLEDLNTSFSAEKQPTK